MSSHISDEKTHVDARQTTLRAGAPCEDALAGVAAAVQHAVQEDVVPHQRAPEVHHQCCEVHVDAGEYLRAMSCS